ncbi:MAG: cupredoxin family copper-binding protein [Thermoleophilia bacterium]|jgi:plastocyanin
MKKAFAILSALLMFGIIFAVASGCGSSSSDSSSDGSGATTDAGNTAEVKMQGSKFTPADLTVEKGTTVTWSNDDSTPHTVTSNSKVFNSGNMNKGQNFGYTFNESGTFEYACTIHPSMKGKVTVK